LDIHSQEHQRTAVPAMRCAGKRTNDPLVIVIAQYFIVAGWSWSLLYSLASHRTDPSHPVHGCEAGNAKAKRSVAEL